MQGSNRQHDQWAAGQTGGRRHHDHYRAAHRLRRWHPRRLEHPAPIM